MRIVSQDMNLSIDEYQYCIYVAGCAIMAKRGDVVYALGGYKTKDRAMEVFSEIHAAYEELPFSGNSVYRMPEE